MVERDEVYRIKTARLPGTLASVLDAIARFGAHVGEIATLKVTPEYNIREIVVIAPNDDVVPHLTAAIADLSGVEIVADSVDRVFAVHARGKLAIRPTVDVRTLQDMREVYTPGVARVSDAIRRDPALTDFLTWRKDTVAIVTDGSRVLGLGDVGPEAALPVMEGKALFYSMFVGINAVPLVLGTNDPAEIVETVLRVAPSFGAIHLEDIASPGVFTIEERLEDALEIPVFHDDQHGTAVVVLAAVLAASRTLDRRLEDLRFGQIGLGAAGSAIASLAASFPFASVFAYDPSPAAAGRFGDLHRSEPRVRITSSETGLHDVIATSDVVVLATGRPGVLKPEWIPMGQVVMALSNPVPEIDRDVARAAGASIATDGAIVNNVLAYPGIMRGALDSRATRVTARMKQAAAATLASLAPESELLPDPLDVSVHQAVATAVAEAADS